MKKTIIAVLAATTVITGASAVSAAEIQCRGMRCGTGVCQMEDCPNNGVPARDGTGLHRRSGGHHGGGNREYCLYR